MDRWKTSWLLRIKKWHLCRKENEMVALRFFATFSNKLLRLQMRLLPRHDSCNGNEMVALRSVATLHLCNLRKQEDQKEAKKNNPRLAAWVFPLSKCICELMRIRLCRGYLRECKRDGNPYPFHTHQHRLRWFCLCKSI